MPPKSTNTLSALLMFKEKQPPEGSDEARRLNQELRQHSIRDSTRKTYQTPLKLFQTLFELPVNGEKLQTYIRALLSAGLISDTIRLYVSAVKTMNSIMGFDVLTQSEQEQVKRALDAADRLAPRRSPVQRAAVMPQEAVIALSELDYVQGSHEYEVRTIALLATCGVLRLGEAVQLKPEHVSRQVEAADLRVTVELPQTKTENGPSRIEIVCSGACTAVFCMAHTLWGLKEITPVGSKLFPTIKQSKVAAEVKAMLRKEYPSRCDSWNLNELKGHSFRRTGATVLLAKGVDSHELKASGRWRSSIWENYVEEHVVSRRAHHPGIILNR
jgi:integrase